MKSTKKVVSVILTLIMVVSMASIAIVDTSAADNPYQVAAQAIDAEYAYDGELGSFYTPEATTFKVWAPTASKVVLNLYATGSDDEEGAEDLDKIEMEKLMDGENWTGVWTTEVQGDILNVYYTYSVTALKNITKDVEDTNETQDVYSHAVGVNGNRSMVVDLSKTNPDGWDSDKHVYVEHQTDAIIWEVQVKDFSFSPSSGVSEANRGKYLAFTENGTTVNGEGDVSTCIDYLKQLGVTHVQINPFYDFGSVDETDSYDQYNWGYDPVNYGVPEGSYASDPYDGNVRIEECKEMIKALHDAGIGVIMDVVYNHTYSRDSCFNYTVPQYYYRIKPMGTYSDQSGCGNDTASERAMYRKYMMDMLKYWTEEYHIDGYRFDLMGIHDVETMNLIRDMLDEEDTRMIMYGEGWSGDTCYDTTTCTGAETVLCSQVYSDQVSDRIGFFNDQIRDGIKAGVFDGATAAGFVSGNMVLAPGVSYGIRANTYGKGCRWDAQTPEQCVTYASCHDNMTLYDKLVATNYGSTGSWRARYADCIKQNKLTSAIVNTSQGIDFMLAGEEMGRSKDGNENSYNASPTLNMIDWTLVETNADLVSYYKGLIELRKSFSPFTAHIKDTSTDKEDVVDDTYAYYFSSSMASGANIIAYTVDNETEGEWNKMAVLYNGSKTTRSFTLSKIADKSLTDDMEWVIVANDKSAGVTKLDEVKGLTFSVSASSAIIAVEKSTFEKANISSNLSRVVVNSIDENTGEVISSNTLLGTTGSGYKTSPDKSVSIKYDYDRAEGNEKGIFSNTETEVNYYYKWYVPDSFTVDKGDVDADGDITIMDATTVQRYLAKIVTLDDEHIAAGDYNYDKETDITDATLLQRYLAKMEVGVYKITTTHTDPAKDKVLCQPISFEARLGTEYTTEAQRIIYYKPITTPENASGIVTGNITVDYEYEYAVDTIDIHIKHSDPEKTWNPFLWAWAYDSQGTAINCYPTWPGLEMTDPDEDGWYSTHFDVPGANSYCVIVNNGKNIQTVDYTDITAPEIWVVINDEKATTKSKWISIYDDAELTNKIA